MIILDTDVLSELMRPMPAAQVSEWVAKQPSRELLTTSIAEAEILLGIELLTQGKRRQGLLRAAEDMINEDLGSRVLGFESEAARPFAQIGAHRRSLGKPISHADAQIAAIARVRGAQLATRNVADFLTAASISLISGTVAAHSPSGSAAVRHRGRQFEESGHSRLVRVADDPTMEGYCNAHHTIGVVTPLISRHSASVTSNTNSGTECRNCKRAF